MQLNDIVVSLELAKQLKEAGYPQESSLFYWVRGIDQPVSYNKDYVPEPTSWEITIWKNLLENYFLIGDGENTNFYLESIMAYDQHYLDVYEIFAAPTASELGEQLKEHDIDYWYSYPDWRLKLHKNSTSDGRSEKEADARAEMWLYLKYQGLLTTIEEK